MDMDINDLHLKLNDGMDRHRCREMITGNCSDTSTDSDDELNMNCMYVCLGFNDTFSTNRLYRTITVG